MQDCPFSLRRELRFTVFMIDQGRGLGEGVGEEQTLLESIDTRLNLIGVPKDKEVAISRIMGKLRPDVTDLKWQHQVYN
jgi:hypothetical protein